MSVLLCEQQFLYFGVSSVSIKLISFLPGEFLDYWVIVLFGKSAPLLRSLVLCCNLLHTYFIHYGVRSFIEDPILLQSLLLFCSVCCFIAEPVSLSHERFSFSQRSLLYYKQSHVCVFYMFNSFITESVSPLQSHFLYYRVSLFYYGSICVTTLSVFSLQSRVLNYRVDFFNRESVTLLFCHSLRCKVILVVSQSLYYRESDINHRGSVFLLGSVSLLQSPYLPNTVSSEITESVSLLQSQFLCCTSFVLQSRFSMRFNFLFTVLVTPRHESGTSSHRYIPFWSVSSLLPESVPLLQSQFLNCRVSFFITESVSSLQSQPLHYWVSFFFCRVSYCITASMYLPQFCYNTNQFLYYTAILSLHNHFAHHRVTLFDT